MKLPPNMDGISVHSSNTAACPRNFSGAVLVGAELDMIERYRALLACAGLNQRLHGMPPVVVGRGRVRGRVETRRRPDGGRAVFHLRDVVRREDVQLAIAV
jgi:hypothetical protein